MLTSGIKHSCVLGTGIMRLKSPRFEKLNTTYTKRSSRQNMLVNKQIADDLIAPEDEEEVNEYEGFLNSLLGLGVVQIFCSVRINHYRF